MLDGLKRLFRGPDRDGFLALFDAEGESWDTLAMMRRARDYGLKARDVHEALIGRSADIVSQATSAGDVVAHCARFAELQACHGLDGAAVDRARTQAMTNLLREYYLTSIDAGGAALDDVISHAADLGIGEAAARDLVREVSSAQLHSYVEEILADGRVSPDEDAGFAELRARLGVSADFDADSQSIIDSARALWQAENGPLPVVDSPLLLRRGEVAHLCVTADAAEQRTRTVSYRHGGPRARLKIMKGVYYSVGSTRIERQTVDYEHDFGSGPLVMTNMRLLWSGPQKNISWKYDSIIDIQLWSDAIEIDRSSGKPMRFYFDKSVITGSLAHRLVTSR